MPEAPVTKPLGRCPATAVESTLSSGPDRQGGKDDVPIQDVRPRDGDYNTAVPGPWAPGDMLYDEGEAKWRITAVVELDSSVYDGLWEVEPIG